MRNKFKDLTTNSNLTDKNAKTPRLNAMIGDRTSTPILMCVRFNGYLSFHLSINKRTDAFLKLGKQIITLSILNCYKKKFTRKQIIHKYKIINKFLYAFIIPFQIYLLLILPIYCFFFKKTN